MKHFNFDDLGESKLFVDLVFNYKTPSTVQAYLNDLREQKLKKQNTKMSLLKKKKFI